MSQIAKSDPQNTHLYIRFIEEMREDPVVAAREILGVELAPHQRFLLRGMWDSLWCILVCGRGGGKTWGDAVYAALSAVLYPGEKIIIVGPGFRQAQFVFKEIESFVERSSVFADSILSGGGRKGTKHNTSEWSMEFKNGSVIYAVPLGTDGSKIRGYRANRLIIDEAVQVPPEIIDKVLVPFMATAKDPVARYLSEEAGEEPESETNNRLVFSTSAFFTFNHMYHKYSEYLKERYRNNNKDYFVAQFNYFDTPDGFIDRKVVELAKKQSTEADFRMEWLAEWVSDTAGFYPASLIDTVGTLNTRPELKGDPDASYVLGVDPALTYNSCGFSVIKLGEPCVVVNLDAVNNMNYPGICSRILDYMSKFNIVRIGLDQGAGMPIIDMFREGRPLVGPDGSSVENTMLLPVDDTSGANGRRIIQLFSTSSQTVTEINFSMKSAMEDSRIAWPKIPGDAQGKTLEEMEYIVENIKQLESEFRMINATQTKAGWYSFSGPANKNKDRYSATLFAYYTAKTFTDIDDTPKTLTTGFWGTGERFQR